MDNEKWNKLYNFAKNYYNHYGNLEIQANFKTVDGINKDEEGVALGAWIQTQRRVKKGKERYEITEEQVKKLEEIGMIWDYFEDKWNKIYELARKYYNYYGNLEIPGNFKTNDGVNFDENGVALGKWIRYQRQAKNGQEVSKITEEQINMLDQIGMIWDKYDQNWNEIYELAKKYYNHYGDLEIKGNFKTIDGINKDENGVELGTWIKIQRQAKKGKNNSRVTEERIKKLDEIEMIWDVNEKKWNDMYELAKKYYNYYGNLKIPGNFKTNDGVNFDENGSALGKWIDNERHIKNKKKNRKIIEKRIQKLDQIGMIWDLEKNKLDVITLCNHYNVDIDKNRIILRKSYNEVYIKICYLNENNISICSKRGNMHPIFFMSDIDMQVEYEISLQYLFEKYIKEKEKKLKLF